VLTLKETMKLLLFKKMTSMKSNRTEGFLLGLVMVLFFTLASSLCHAQKQADLESEPKTISILEGDSIKADRVFLSFFDRERVDTITRDFEEISYVGERVNVQIEGKEQHSSGQWLKGTYFFTNVLLGKEGTTITLDRNYASLGDYKEQDCLTLGMSPFYNIIVKNQTDQFVFKLLDIYRNYRHNKWDYCFSSYDNIRNVLSPKSEGFLEGIEIDGLKETVFTFGIYDPESHELNEVTVENYTVKGSTITIVLVRQD
jgi:hypothetical protein